MFYGGFFVRLAAAWTDAFLVSCALITLRIPVWFMSGSDNLLFRPFLFDFCLWDIFLYLLGTAYYVFLTYTTGSTLGKRLFSLQVVAADGSGLSLWDVLYRESIGKYLSGAFFCIGYIMAGIDREKRAFHDMLSDTRVVYRFARGPAAPAGAAEAAGRYRDVAEYYTRNNGKYKAADYGLKKPEEPEQEAEKTPSWDEVAPEEKSED